MAILFCTLGWDCQQFRQYELAINAYNQAISLQPENPWPILRRGICHKKVGDLAAAAIDFNTVMSDHPDSAEAIYLSAIQMTSSNEERINQLTEALRRNKDFPEAWFSRAEILYSIGNSEDALRA